MSQSRVARPNALNPALLGRVRESTKQPAQLRAELAAEGVEVSLRTIQRARAGATAPKSPGRSPNLTESLRARREGTPPPAPRDAPPATLEDELAALRRRKARLETTLDLWADSMQHSPQAVLSHGRLLAQLAQVTGDLITLTPRPEADRYVPIEGEALAALLTRSVAAASADETQALRDRVQAQAAAIDALAASLGED